MTANVTIVTAHRDNVLRIPMDALRFAPAGTPLAQANPLDGATSRRHARVWVPMHGGGDTAGLVTIGLDDGNKSNLSLASCMKAIAWSPTRSPPSRRPPPLLAALRRRRASLSCRPVIEIVSLTKTYVLGEVEVHALRGVSLKSSAANSSP